MVFSKISSYCFVTQVTETILIILGGENPPRLPPPPGGKPSLPFLQARRKAPSPPAKDKQIPLTLASL